MKELVICMIIVAVLSALGILTIDFICWSLNFDLSDLRAVIAMGVFGGLALYCWVKTS